MSYHLGLLLLCWYSYSVNLSLLQQDRQNSNESIASHVCVSLLYPPVEGIFCTLLTSLEQLRSQLYYVFRPS